jgi:hypothetical protein
MLLLHFSKDFVPMVRCGFPIDVQQTAQLSSPLFSGRLFLSVGVPRRGREGLSTRLKGPPETSLTKRESRGRVVRTRVGALVIEKTGRGDLCKVGENRNRVS